MIAVDRSRLPVPGPDRPFHFPRIVRRTLANGLELRAVTHTSVPVLSMVLLVPGGSSVDPADRHGLTSITAGLLDEGSRGESALEVADRVARIGGDLDVEVGADAVVLSMTTLDRFLPEAVDLLHEVVAEPNLAADDFNRIRNLRLERLRQMKDHAGAVAERAFARVVYQDHAYGHLSLGTVIALTAATVDEARAHHAALFAPAGCTLVIAGERPEEELLDRAAAVFGLWQPRRSETVVNRAASVAPPPEAPMARLGVVPRAGAAQSELRIGGVSARRSTPDYHALVMLNAILGGQFVSRVNLKLREEKGYTYGVRTGFDLRLGRGPFVFQSSVGTDVTAAAILDALAEIRDIASSRPPTDDELSLAFTTLSKGYARNFETVSQVARSVAQLALHDLPDTYFEEFVPRLAQITTGEVTRVAREYLDLSKMTTLIVGDLDKIAASLPDLGLGSHEVLTPDI